MLEMDSTLTAEGAARLEGHLRDLLEVRRPALADIIRTARETGEDPAEGGDYAQALLDMSILAAEIAALRARLATAAVVKQRRRRSDEAELGSQVAVQFDDGSIERFRLVGPLESDALAGRLSKLSPLGRALLGKRAGETVDWLGPGGPETARVVKVA